MISVSMYVEVQDLKKTKHCLFTMLAAFKMILAILMYLFF